jgi:hypothetical protein
MQNAQHRIHVGKHTRLGSAERGKPAHRESSLEPSDIVLSQRDVLQEVSGAGYVGRLNSFQVVR